MDESNISFRDDLCCLRDADLGSVTMRMDDLGLNAGVFVFDLFVRWEEGGDWAVSGARIDTMNGATLAYHFQDLADANGVPIDTTNAGPGLNHPFNTFMSTPLPAGAGGRFNSNFQGNLAGGAIPAVPTPTRTATQFNVALFDTSETPVDATDRAVLRIALNINEAPALGDTVYFSQRGPLAPGDVQVATLQSLNDGRGCSAGGLLSFNGDFYATPEPASAVLLSLGGLACLRRRRPQLRATLAAGQ